MAKLPFAGVIPLTTTNRSRCLYRSTSFCVASCCTSFRKASCASRISAFWPTGGAEVQLTHFNLEPARVVAYAWSRDGKKFAVTRALYNSTDVVVFGNFR
jgi:hypothetical protein